jgi:hypothetical protein
MSNDRMLLKSRGGGGGVPVATSLTALLAVTAGIRPSVSASRHKARQHVGIRDVRCVVLPSQPA